MIILLLIAYLLNIVDYLFTAHWVRLYGLEIEANPIGRWMFENNIAGAFKILVVGVLFAVLECFIKRHPNTAWIAYILLVVYALIAGYHIVLWVTTL